MHFIKISRAHLACAICCVMIAYAGNDEAEHVAHIQLTVSCEVLPLTILHPHELNNKIRSELALDV